MIVVLLKIFEKPWSIFPEQLESEISFRAKFYDRLFKKHHKKSEGLFDMYGLLNASIEELDECRRYWIHYKDNV